MIRIRRDKRLHTGPAHQRPHNPVADEPTERLGQLGNRARPRKPTVCGMQQLGLPDGSCEGSAVHAGAQLAGHGDGAEVRLAVADGTLFAGANSTVRGLTTR
jgi:hypothetical protein